MAKVLMILFAFGLSLSGMLAGSAEAKDATGYTISCPSAETYIENSKYTLKQSATRQDMWVIYDKSWYGVSDSVKQQDLAYIYTYMKCQSTNGEGSAITLVCNGQIVAKTDYTGRPFLLRVMP